MLRRMITLGQKTKHILNTKHPGGIPPRTWPDIFGRPDHLMHIHFGTGFDLDRPWSLEGISWSVEQESAAPQEVLRAR